MTANQKAAINEACNPDHTYLIEQIADYFQPDDIFSDEQLKAWCEENRYNKLED